MVVIVAQSIYTHVTKQMLEEFNAQWTQYVPETCPLPTLLHNYEDGKAAVFNTWLRYSFLYEHIFLKPDKLITHNIVELIAAKFSVLLDRDIELQIRESIKDVQFHFLFSYYVTHNVLLHLENFLKLDEFKYLQGYIKHNYYALTIEDIDKNDPLFYFTKELTIHYVHERLTKGVVHKIVIDAISNAKRTVQHEVQTTEIDSQTERYS